VALSMGSERSPGPILGCPDPGILHEAHHNDKSDPTGGSWTQKNLFRFGQIATFGSLVLSSKHAQIHCSLR